MLLVRLKNELSHHLYLCQHYLQLIIDIVAIIIDRIYSFTVFYVSGRGSIPGLQRARVFLRGRTGLGGTGSVSARCLSCILWLFSIRPIEFLKRAMYGRAGVELLRARLL